MRAWADDLAMIVPEGVRRYGELQKFFNDFARVSGLQLNLPKTTVVPIYPYAEAEVRTQLALYAPD